jgi:hypothetical protein
MQAPGWQQDLLGEGYRQRVLELGADPDGEGSIAAVLVFLSLPEPREQAYAVLAAWLDAHQLTRSAAAAEAPTLPSAGT